MLPRPGALHARPMREPTGRRSPSGASGPSQITFSGTLEWDEHRERGIVTARGQGGALSELVSRVVWLWGT